jgi:hypothetical protein
MLTIRSAQMQVLSAQQRRQFVESMCAFLHNQFKEELEGMSQSSLHLQVSDAIDRARGYGLRSHRDCCRFLNLAVIYGWEFDRLPENAWMQECLTDPNVGDPSQRIQRLVSQCVYRMEVEESNRKIREGFGYFKLRDADEEEEDEIEEEEELLVAKDWGGEHYQDPPVDDDDQEESVNRLMETEELYEPKQTDDPSSIPSR